MGDIGDTPIRVEEYQFTVSDMAFLSGVPQKTIRNWLTREVLNVGKKHFLGRWTFNLLDAARLLTMYDLAVRFALPLDKAALAADGVAKIIMDSTQRDARTGELLDIRDGFRPNVNLLLSIDDKGEWYSTVANIKEAGKYYPPTYDKAQSDRSLASLRRTHIVVPVYAIMRDLTEAMCQLAERNASSEGGSDED